MKQKKAIIITFILAVLLTSAVWGYCFLIMNIEWRLTSPCLMVIADYGGGKHVYLYQSGFQDRDVSLCIPLAQGFTKIKRITSWSSPDVDVIWSQDRSVLAIELNDYFAAYDFKTGNVIADTKSNSGTESANNSKNIDSQIRALLNSRGGKGNVVSCTYGTYVHMTYKDWKKFQEGLKAGEQTPFPVIQQ